MNILSFLILGFLIGNLAGLSAAGIVRDLLPLLFAFGGGSAVGLLGKLDEQNKQAAYQAIFALSLSCLVGVYTGILVSEYQLLTPEHRRGARAAEPIAELKYLRSLQIQKADEIDQKLANGMLNPRQAYEALYELVKQQGQKQ